MTDALKLAIKQYNCYFKLKKNNNCWFRHEFFVGSPSEISIKNMKYNRQLTYFSEVVHLLVCTKAKVADRLAANSTNPAVPRPPAPSCCCWPCGGHTHPHQCLCCLMGQNTALLLVVVCREESDTVSAINSRLKRVCVEKV